MFGRRKDDPVEPPPPPYQSRPRGQGEAEGQAGYIPIDDAADLPLTGSDGGTGSEPADSAAALRAELDEVNDRWKRAMADFQNYQRRAGQNEQEARRQGITAVVMSVVPVLDHFDLALSQKMEGDSTAAASILEGVKVIRAELVRALEKHGVRVIQPAPNDPFDPMRHEAIMHQAAENVEPGHIASTFQPGFELGDRTIRSAKVAVAPGESSGDNN